MLTSNLVPEHVNKAALAIVRGFSSFTAPTCERTFSVEYFNILFAGTRNARCDLLYSAMVYALMDLSSDDGIPNAESHMYPRGLDWSLTPPAEQVPFN